MAMDVDQSEKSSQSGPTPNRKYNKLRYPKAFPFKKLSARATQMEHKRLLMDFAILCCLQSPQMLLYPCHIFQTYTTFEGSDQWWRQEFEKAGASQIRQNWCIFEESDTGAASKVKSPRNLAHNS